jgi:hypothetical protein
MMPSEQVAIVADAEIYRLATDENSRKLRFIFPGPSTNGHHTAAILSGSPFCD